MAGWIRKHMSARRGDQGKLQVAVDGQDSAGQGELPEIEVADVFESTEYSLTDYEMESTGDLQYVISVLKWLVLSHKLYLRV